MKRVALVVLLILEVVFVFAFFYLPAKRKAQFISIGNCEIPEDMTLTVEDELVYRQSDQTITVSQGTEIVGQHIPCYDGVVFEYKDSAGIHFVSATWDSFKEKDQLATLWEEHMQKKEQVMQPVIRAGAVRGIAFGVCWLVLSGILSIVLFKRDKFRLLMSIHISALFLLGAAASAYIFFAYFLTFAFLIGTVFAPVFIVLAGRKKATK